MPVKCPICGLPMGGPHKLDCHYRDPPPKAGPAPETEGAREEDTDQSREKGGSGAS